jgi:hypothetical protein
LEGDSGAREKQSRRSVLGIHCGGTFSKKTTSMNSKQIKEAKRGVAMLAFAEERVADFTHNPLTAADVKHAETITKADAAITGLGGKEAIQKAGEFAEKTEEQRGDRGTVESALRKINGTVAAIASETKQPGLMDRFRMPHGNGDSESAAKLKGFADAIDELGLLPQLAAHNLIVTTDGLRQMAKDLKDGPGEQALARGKQAGATASIPELLATLRECKKTWDALYNNTYDGNTEMLATWRSVSHVERDGGGDSTPATPPAPTTPTK